MKQKYILSTAVYITNCSEMESMTFQFPVGGSNHQELWELDHTVSCSPDVFQ